MSGLKIKRISFFKNLFLIFAMLCLTLIAHAEDPLQKGGCMPLAKANQLVKQLKMSGIAVLHGNSVFLPIRDENYRFVLNTYIVGGKQCMVLTVRDMPSERNPSNAWVVFFSDESLGVLASLEHGTPASKSWITGGRFASRSQWLYR